VTTEVALFLKACPAKVVGVTGTNGKSSTTSMVAHLLGRCFEEESSPRRVFAGGNLGGSLLDRLPEIAPSDWVVLELSSFQLHYFDASIPRPSIVVLTPCVANHLNWHGSMEHYIGSKQKIFASRGTSQFLVCDRTASEAATRDLPEGVLPLQTVPADHLGCLASLGAHQVRNAQLAVPAAMAVGRVEALCNVQGRLEEEVEEGEKIRYWVSRFSGWSPPPMRLQPIGMLRRHPLFNDSASTTPESSEAAATALPGGWFLIGGADKGANYDSLIRTLALQAKGAAFFGTIGPSLFRIMRRRFPTFPTFYHQGFQKGLRWILEHAESEEPVVFSPGCAGWDQFLHYRRRGEIFEEFVSRLPFFTAPQ
jgi:UDP-N-acetylmuramoylalanine--D-glutamate ligase